MWIIITVVLIIIAGSLALYLKMEEIDTDIRIAEEFYIRKERNVRSNKIHNDSDRMHRIHDDNHKGHKVIPSRKTP